MFWVSREREGVGHSQVLVLGDPTGTMVLQDDDWGHMRLRHQFLIVQLRGKEGQVRASRIPFPTFFPTPSSKPKPHHNKYCIREEFCNPPSNFQGQGPRAV